VLVVGVDFERVEGFHVEHEERQVVVAVSGGFAVAERGGSEGSEVDGLLSDGLVSEMNMVGLIRRMIEEKGDKDEAHEEVNVNIWMDGWMDGRHDGHGAARGLCYNTK
jgi:hypothetical protein